MVQLENPRKYTNLARNIQDFLANANRKTIVFVDSYDPSRRAFVHLFNLSLKMNKVIFAQLIVTKSTRKFVLLDFILWAHIALKQEWNQPKNHTETVAVLCAGNHIIDCSLWVEDRRASFLDILQLRCGKFSGFLTCTDKPVILPGNAIVGIGCRTTRLDRLNAWNSVFCETFVSQCNNSQ